MQTSAFGFYPLPHVHRRPLVPNPIPLIADVLYGWPLNEIMSERSKEVHSKNSYFIKINSSQTKISIDVMVIKPGSYFLHSFNGNFWTVDLPTQPSLISQPLTCCSFVDNLHTLTEIIEVLYQNHLLKNFNCQDK